MSLESVVEKCNMLKAALDRFTIPYEDVVLPQKTKYTMLRSIPKELREGSLEWRRFREKISKNNMPSMIAPPLMIEEDDGTDD